MSTQIAPQPARISTVVTALFPDSSSAERGWNAAIARGYKPADISAIVSQETQKKLLAVGMPPAKEFKGAGLGSAIGTPVGALVAILAAVGSAILLPGVGLVLAGPIVAAVAGAGAGGAIIGGIVGAMVGADMSENHVKQIEEHVKNGGFVLTVQAKSSLDADAIGSDWKEYAVEVIR